MRADTKETVDDLLNVAERLFAKHGVEQVALTRIVGSSRQRNRSALHYHFGSRAGVLKAVLDRRLKEINGLRHATLDDDAHAGSGLANAVYALIAPLCLVVLNRPWGSDYISILAQIGFHPGALGERALDDTNLSSVRHCKRLIEEALPAIPPAVLTARFRWLSDSVILAVARWSRSRSKSSRTRETMDSLIEAFIAYGVAALSAPRVTLAAVDAPRKTLQARTAAR
jgi:AcrR family transcriptional regulator